MIARESFQNRNCRPQNLKKINEKQNIGRSQAIASKQKTYLPHQNNQYYNDQNKIPQKNRERGLSNRLLTNKISPKKFGPNEQVPKYPQNHKNPLSEKNLLQKESSKGENFCQNHKNKVAKYKIISDQDTLNYCEKCSIFLASQGFSVSRIDALPIQSTSIINPSMINTQYQNDQLETHINCVLKQLQQKQEKIKKQISQVQTHKKQIQVNLEVYFNKVVQALLQKKKQFLEFVESQHLKILQKYKEQQIGLQKTILESLSIRASLGTGLAQSEKIYLKNQIKSFRILCEKIGVSQQAQKKDIVTVDLAEILELINEKFCIKVRYNDQDNHFQIKNSSDEDEQTGDKPQKLKSIAESQIAKISDKFSLFSSEDNFE